MVPPASLVCAAGLPTRRVSAHLQPSMPALTVKFARKVDGPGCFVKGQEHVAAPKPLVSTGRNMPPILISPRYSNRLVHALALGFAHRRVLQSTVISNTLGERTGFFRLRPKTEHHKRVRPAAEHNPDIPSRLRKNGPGPPLKFFVDYPNGHCFFIAVEATKRPVLHHVPTLIQTPPDDARDDAGNHKRHEQLSRWFLQCLAPGQSGSTTSLFRAAGQETRRANPACPYRSMTENGLVVKARSPAGRS